MFPLLSSKLFSLEKKTIEIWMPFPSSLPSTSSCWNAELRQTTNYIVGVEHSETKRLLVSLLLIGRKFKYITCMTTWTRWHKAAIHSTLSNLQGFSVCMHWFVIIIMSRGSNVHPTNVVCMHIPTEFLFLILHESNGILLSSFQA